MKKNILLLCFGIVFGKLNAQDSSFDFGAGAVISIGFQEEWAFDIRTHYHTNEHWGFSGEYNLFFRRDVIARNTETFSEIALNANYKLMHFWGISIFAGLGYVGNNFEMNHRDPDSSKLYVETGSFNHGAQLKFLGLMPLGTRVKLFTEINFKSFGRRYDTFAFGLLYSIPLY